MGKAREKANVYIGKTNKGTKRRARERRGWIKQGKGYERKGYA